MPERADELRRRIVKIDDECRSVDGDDFSRRYALLTEADNCRAELAGLVADELAASADWAVRAGRKGTHEIDPEIAKARVQVMTPGLGAP